MRNILVLFIIALTSCNSVKITQTATSQSNDSTGTSITRSVQKSSEDNLNIKRDDGSWTRTIIYPPSASLHKIPQGIPSQGVTVIETGTYNRDEVVKDHKDSYNEYNLYHHYNIYHNTTVTKTVTEKKRFAWLPFLFLAIGGIGVFLATRIPLIVSLIMAVIKLVISKFQKHKTQNT